MKRIRHKQTHHAALLFFYWDLGLGGIQKKISDVICQIKKSYPETEISLLLNSFSQQNPNQCLLLPTLPKKIRVIIDPLWRFRRFILPYILFVIYFLKNNDITIIVAYNHRHNIIATAASKVLFRKHIKVILNQDIPLSQNLKDVFCHHPFKLHIWTMLVRFWYPRSSNIVVPNQEIKLDLIHNFQINAERIQVVHNWTSQTQHLKTSKKIYSLLFVGRLSKQKQPKMLVSCIESLNEKTNHQYRMAIVGDGELKNSVEQMIKRSKLKQQIKLISPKVSVKTYYEQSRVLILTSSYEGEPLVILEAYAHQLPVIALWYPGIEEVIIHNQTGLIAKNMDELEQHACNLLTNKKLYRDLSRGAYRNFLKYHTSDKNLRIYIEKLIH